MEKAPGSVLSPILSSKKAAARAALVDLKDSSRRILADCFRQFGVEAVAMSSDAAERLKREKYEACVLGMGPGAQPVLEAVRTSPSNSRMVVYGLGGSAQEAMKHSKYGINAMFHEPLERQAALKLVRATQMLVLHEFRRYVRIPVITEVSVAMADGQRFTCTSREVSAGGMSLTSKEDLAPGQSVEISFALLTLPRIWARGTISWRKAGNQGFGIRFDPLDERRIKIKEWVDAYFEG